MLWLLTETSWCGVLLLIHPPCVDVNVSTHAPAILHAIPCDLSNFSLMDFPVSIFFLGSPAFCF